MPGRVIAVVKDLFFVARIRETARMVGAPLDFARAPDEIRAALAGDPAPSLVLIDLTTPGWDYAEVFAGCARRLSSGASSRLSRP